MHRTRPGLESPVPLGWSGLGVSWVCLGMKHPMPGGLGEWQGPLGTPLGLLGLVALPGLLGSLGLRVVVLVVVRRLNVV